MVLGSFSTTAMEEVAEAGSPGLQWLQLYIFRDRELTRSLITQAERVGFKAIVLTVDQPVIGPDSYKSASLPPHISFPDIGLSGPINKEKVRNLIDSSVTWEEVDWVKGLTKLPVVLKGILTAEDAVEAVRHGVQGIIVSNHGGRQLDGVLASIDALGEVVRAVEGRVEVYMDGGVRRGTDVLKALAMGARAVFIGRPVLWGLAYKGQEGVGRVLEILREELKSAMVLSGVSRVTDIKAELLVH
ncbi:Hydroxyacid oxidase 1 [Geodia barretti]|nr:Hydroxyacid oxidase 1 [Geodia barretti]